MRSFDLREEIDHNGRRYFLQTSLIPQKECIQSSFFKNGVLFDTNVRKVGGGRPQAELKSLVREYHKENKRKLVFLLDVREKIKASKDPRSHLKLAQALFRRALYAEAIQEAEQVVANGNLDAQAYKVIGESYYRLGDYEKAFKAVQMGIEVNPEYPDMHNLMGQIYLKEKKCKAAVESFKRAVALNLYYGAPYLNLVRAYLLNTVVKEDYELSRQLEEIFLSNIERASQLDPLIHGDELEEAKHLFKEKRYEETLGALNGIKLESGRSDIDDIVLELYLMLLSDSDGISEDDIQDYLDRVLRIIEENPTYADGYNSLGILYTAKCKILMDKASGAFRKALEINKKYKKAQKNLRLAENDRQGIFILLKALLD